MYNPSDLIAAWITCTRMPAAPPKDETAFSCLERHIFDYDGMSKRARLKYNFLRLIQIVCAATIPLFSMNSNVFSPLLTGSLGVAIVVASSIEFAAQYHDKWIRWRRTWQHLVILRQAYLYKSDDLYKNESKRDANLIMRLNSILEEEYGKWHESSVNTQEEAAK